MKSQNPVSTLCLVEISHHVNEFEAVHDRLPFAVLVTKVTPEYMNMKIISTKDEAIDIFEDHPSIVNDLKTSFPTIDEFALLTIEGNTIECNYMKKPDSQENNG